MFDWQHWLCDCASALKVYAIVGRSETAIVVTTITNEISKRGALFIISDPFACLEFDFL